MSTVTFFGGPFDGVVRALDPTDPAQAHDFGVVLKSEQLGMYPRWTVYLPNGDGGVVFDSYAASFDEGLARLRKGNA